MKKFKRALITGASRGLGKEITKQLQSKCESLVLLGRDQKNLEALKVELKEKYGFPGDIDLLSVDLSRTDALEKIKSFSKEVDLLINNAGVGFVDYFENMSEKQLHDMMIVNMYSLTFLTNHFAKNMIAMGGGQIINVASVAAFLSIPYFSVYAATKSYVLSFSQAVDVEFKKHNVRVKAICPGGIWTDFHTTAGVNESAIGANKRYVAAPEVIAKAVIDLIENSKSSTTPLMVNKFIAFLSRVLPSELQTDLVGKTYRQYIKNN